MFREYKLLQFYFQSIELNYKSSHCVMHVLSFVAAVYYGNIMGTAMHHGMLIHFSCSSEITSARCFRVLSLSISKELYHVFLKPK